MFTRATGFLIVPSWLAAMTWLIAHDVWPKWLAPDPPLVQLADLLNSDSRETQYTISDSHGVVGDVWTSYLVDEGSIRRDDLVWLDRLSVPIVPLRITATSIFTAQGVLDEFEARIENPDLVYPIQLHGERFHSDFSFRLENGARFRTFKVPLTEGGLIAGMFSPFADYRDLKVGQSWRMQVFNPLAALTNFGSRFLPLLVKVTGEERINTGSWAGNCLVLEAGQTKAWVSADGQVRLQEVTLPVVGKVRVVRQAQFNAEARNEARKQRLLVRGFDEE